MKLKVTPIINTLGTKVYKDFVNKEFNLENLQTYFRNIDNSLNIKYHLDDYIISFKEKEYRFPLPKTINDFINDMNRVGYQLYWTNWMYENLEPKDYLNKNTIKEHYAALLKTIDKSHELL